MLNFMLHICYHTHKKVYHLRPSQLSNCGFEYVLSNLFKDHFKKNLIGSLWQTLRRAPPSLIPICFVSVLSPRPRNLGSVFLASDPASVPAGAIVTVPLSCYEPTMCQALRLPRRASHSPCPPGHIGNNQIFWVETPRTAVSTKLGPAA